MRSSVVLRVTSATSTSYLDVVEAQAGLELQQTAQVGFSELFAGAGRLWSRLFGHIQGDGHATKRGGSIVLDAACEAHGVEMALALSPCECERSNLFLGIVSHLGVVALIKAARSLFFLVRLLSKSSK